MQQVPWRDTREWLERVEGAGELRVVRNASWETDIGAINEMLDHAAGSPAVLFDDVPGYPSGFRVLSNASGTPRRQAITLGLPVEEGTDDGLLRFWRRTLDDLKPIPPIEVDSAPILENVLEGDDVDLLSFPTPRWHPEDGGRFIGTASMNIMKARDSDYVNFGTYRNQIFDAASMGVWISPGKHGRLIMQDYFDRGEPCPIVVVVGADPLLFMASCAEGIAYGQSEYSWAGGVRGEAIQVVRGRHTGLPIPATAEIAIEGFIEANDEHPEGPYGEWAGYYSSGAPTTPAIRVKAIYHRDDPILLGCPQGKFPHEDNRFLAYMKSILVEKQLAGAGVPGVTAVWCPPEAGSRLLVNVAIKQMYPGHATQTLHVAAQCGTIAYGGRYVVVVDDDIDVFNRDDVLWALGTRVDPVRDTSIIERAWSTTIDPPLGPGANAMSSRLLIDATRPWEWRNEFSKVIVTGADTRRNREQWGWILDGSPDPRS